MLSLYRRARRKAWMLSLCGLERGETHVTRYSMYRSLRSLKLPKKSGRILSVSHSAKLGEVLDLRPTEIVEANYPEFSMTALPFDDTSFDFVLSDQVLEHVEGNPQTAVDECKRVLIPGGIACHTTCFINPVHGAPKDFWRFTTDALRLLHKEWSATLQCEAWGNFVVWQIVKDGMRYEKVPKARWHPLHRLAIKNDPEWPIHTWIVAQK